MLLWEARLRWKAINTKLKEKGGKENGAISTVGSPSSSRYERFVEVGQAFTFVVRNSLRQLEDLPDNTIIFAYDTGALEVFEWCRERGFRCVLGQMDPGRVEIELVREEEKCWPGWATCVTELPEEYSRRREREWALADRIVVNSEFCREALVRQGVQTEKLVVIPLAFEMEDEAEVRGQRTEDRGQKSVVSGQWSVVSGPQSSTLRVLFLGQVILRKGIQYLVEAARKLEKESVHFDIVGPIGISQKATASAPRNMTFHGPVSRDGTAGWYRKADLFILPTLSDGFALTQLEALAHGLPVIATPNCARVVEEGKTGFIIPPRDPQALAEAILRFVRNPGLGWEMAPTCRDAVKTYSIDAYGRRLVESFGNNKLHSSTK